MTTPLQLKSAEFRREREENWRELEQLISRVEQKRSDDLNPRELYRLPLLYRATLSSLSVARSISLDRNLLLYLENLAARAYLCVYGVRARPAAMVAAFFTRGLPQAVRAARWHILLASLAMLIGIVGGTLAILDNPELFYSLLSQDQAGGRTPLATKSELQATLFGEPPETDLLTVFASFLFTNNARVGFLAFSVGFAFGVPTLIILLLNGLGVGALTAVFVNQGLGIDLWGWLLVHGTTELLAIVICGGAGLMLGGALLFPGRHSRLANLATAGRQAATIVVGAVILLFVAALLEGFARQLVGNTIWRYLIGAGMLGLWLAYFSLAGRERRHD